MDEGWSGKGMLDEIHEALFGAAPAEATPVQTAVIGGTPLDPRAFPQPRRRASSGLVQKVERQGADIAELKSEVVKLEAVVWVLAKMVAAQSGVDAAELQVRISEAMREIAPPAPPVGVPTQGPYR